MRLVEGLSIGIAGDSCEQDAFVTDDVRNYHRYRSGPGNDSYR